MRRVYLDHNATSPLRDSVKEGLRSLLGHNMLANPSSIHTQGRYARKLIDQAREQVARYVGTSPQNVVFTSGGTESNQLVYLSVLTKPLRILSTALEHSCVLGAHEAVRRCGGHVEILPLSEDTYRHPSLPQAQHYDLISIHMANNETGLCFPFEAWLADAGSRGPLHSDGVQALGKLPIVFDESPFTWLSLSGHKIGALQGVGALLRKPHCQGLGFWGEASQEKGHRGGTENILGIVSMGLACQELFDRGLEEQHRLRALQALFEEELCKRISDVTVVGKGLDRLPNTSCVIFEGVDGESLMMAADLDGLDLSMGAACSSGALEPSHVLLNMGLSPQRAKSALRFSTGWSTSQSDLEVCLDKLPRLVERIRKSR